MFLNSPDQRCFESQGPVWVSNYLGYLLLNRVYQGNVCIDNWLQRFAPRLVYLLPVGRPVVNVNRMKPRFTHVLSPVLMLALFACSTRSEVNLATQLADTLFPLPERVYSGFYTAGFEQSDFRPCGSSGLWFVVSERTANFAHVNAVLKRMPGDQIAPGVFTGQKVFVKWCGRPSRKGRYGHMGGCDREFLLSSVLAVRAPQPDDCH